ncbi:MAG: AMIN-like domain-containing (lipo)protein, partial [Gaiellaceae bacterium]
PVTVPATNEETALLTDVRAARHEGYDRVVFEFGNVLPGYDVRYVAKPVHADGSGHVVPVAGNHVVQVRMENALDADLTQESAPPTYTGPQRFSPPTPELVELVRTGGFEAVLTWAAGLNDRVDFRVLTLQGQPRLVVDFRNH